MLETTPRTEKPKYRVLLSSFASGLSLTLRLNALLTLLESEEDHTLPSFPVLLTEPSLAIPLKGTNLYSHDLITYDKESKTSKPCHI